MKGTTSHEQHDSHPDRSAVHRDHRRRPRATAQHYTHSSHRVTPTVLLHHRPKYTRRAIAIPPVVLGSVPSSTHAQGQCRDRANVSIQQVVQPAATHDVNGYELAPSGSSKRQVNSVKLRQCPVVLTEAGIASASGVNGPGGPQ
jgi:hypothetical protein